MNKVSLVYFLSIIFIIFLLTFAVPNNFGFQLFYLFYSFILIILTNRFFKEFEGVIFFSSILNLILLLLFYSYNFKVNQYGFFPNFDDSFYYNQASLVFRDNYDFDTLYEIPLSLMMLLGADDALSLVSFNWFLSSILLGLIGVFSKKINQNFKSYYLLFIALNMFYLEATVVLLRDILGFVFFFMALIFILNKNIKFNFFAILTFLVRPTTSIFIYVFYLFYENKFLRKNYKGKFFVITSFCFIVFLIFNYLPLGFLTRSGFDGVGSDFTLSNMNSTRMEMVTDDEGDVTSKLLAMGIIGAPLVMLVNIFTPLRFRDLYSDIEYIFLDGGVYTSLLQFGSLDYKSILNFIHIFVLGFWLIPFFNGVFNILNKHKENKYILYVFLLGLFFVSFVSFQPRHKLHFLMFLPVICSFSDIKIKNLLIMGLFIDFFISLLLIKDLI